MHDSREVLLGKNCEVGKLMKFLKEIGLFDDTKKYHEDNESEEEWLTMKTKELAMSYSLK